MTADEPICKDLPMEKRYMKRMSCEQQHALQNEYIKNPNWSSDQIYALSRHLGLTRTKVYKWNWDRRNKLRYEMSEH